MENKSQLPPVIYEQVAESWILTELVYIKEKAVPFRLKLSKFRGV